MHRILWVTGLVMLVIGCTPQPQRPTTDQNWSDADRAAFYSLDQGSQIMPLAWMNALKQPNGQPFLADNLSRYGYLWNDTVQNPKLPIGFTASGPAGQESIGMTCAACHTRQIEVQGAAYRIEGGPAIVDFQTLLADLDIAVQAVKDPGAAFDAFADAVLPKPITGTDRDNLRTAVNIWWTRYHTLMQRALPVKPRDPGGPWGPARLDAVSMIFNRLTGLDIGNPPYYLLAANIMVADAPVRYPFLWNAPVQDRTQWPGFAANGDDLLGLARNLGEVYGVFATFHPVKAQGTLLGIDYLGTNSADFTGLGRAEALIKKLGPPRFPWPIDAEKAAKGKTIFDRAAADGGCKECHGISEGETRLWFLGTWKTPLIDVQTDVHEHAILERKVSTGVLTGASLFGLTPALKPTDTAFNTLGLSVVGSIAQKIAPSFGDEQSEAPAPTNSPMSEQALAKKLKAQAVLMTASPEIRELGRTFTTPAAGSAKYESRVMQGIWAAAPYLHNGSVPTLADLLKPADKRPTSFKIGPEYDPVAVGLATKQTKFDFTLNTTDCSDRNSGNSRCGHEYGTSLPEDDKAALLEYLKTL
jgi:hypothetical protein